MQRSIFESYLRKVNNMFRLKNRKIILLADNVSSHKVNDLELSNVKLCFLPPKYVDPTSTTRPRNYL